MSSALTLTLKPVLILSAKDDRGAGSVLALVLVGAVLGVAGLLLTLAWALGLKHSLQTTAESGALAAADTASGAVAGYPCDVAAEAAQLGNVHLDSCALDGLIATVTVSRSIFGVEVIAEARAGPGGPPDEATRK